MHSVVHSFKDHIWLSAPDFISRTGTEMKGFPRDEKGRTGKERRNYDKVRGEAAMWESAKGGVKPEPPIWRGDKCEQDGITGLTVWHRSAWTGNLPLVTHLLSHLNNWTGKTGRELEWTLRRSMQILSSGLRILAGSLDIALSFKRLPRSRSGSHQTKDWLMWGCRGPASCQFRAATKSHKRVWNAVFACNLKNYKMISVCFQGKPFNITIIQIYVPTTSAQKAEDDWFYEDLLKLTPEKRCLFIIGDWDSKVGSQAISGVTGKFGLGVQNEAGQRLTEFCQENTLVIANTLFQQHKRWLYIWTSPDDQYRNQIDYILCSQRQRSSIQSAKTKPRADCGSDHEFPIAKFRLKWKKVEKTTRPFRYDLNQFPYNLQ